MRIRKGAIGQKELEAILEALDFRSGDIGGYASNSDSAYVVDLRCQGRSRWKSDTATRVRGSIFPCVHGVRMFARYVMEKTGAGPEDMSLSDYNYGLLGQDAESAARQLLRVKCSCTPQTLATYGVGVNHMLEFVQKRAGTWKDPATQPDQPIPMQQGPNGLMLPVFKDPAREQYQRLMQKPPGAPDMEGTLVLAFRAYTLGPWPQLLVGTWGGEWKTKQLVAECRVGDRKTQKPGSSQNQGYTPNWLSLILFEDEGIDPKTGLLMPGAPEKDHTDQVNRSAAQEKAERDLLLGMVNEEWAKECQEHLLYDSCPGGTTGCGIYAYFDPKLAFNQVSGGKATGTVVSLVALKGLVRQHETGYQASHAEMMKLWLVKADDTLGTERYDDAMAAMLTLYFGVDVDVLSKTEWEQLVKDELSKTPRPELFKEPPMKWPWEDD